MLTYLLRLLFLLLFLLSITLLACDSGGGNSEDPNVDDDDIVQPDDDDDPPIPSDDDDDDDPPPPPSLDCPEGYHEKDRACFPIDETIPDPPLVDPTRIQGIHLSFLTDVHNSMAITWLSPQTEEKAGVWWGETPDALDQSEPGRARFFDALDFGADEVHLANIYWVNLTDLEPNSTYYYKVINADASSKTYSFTTGPPLGSQTPITFLVIGDTRGDEGDAPSPNYPKLVERIKSETADFIINTGDITDTSFQSEWDRYWEDSSDLYAQLPSMYVQGNHDFGIGLLGETYVRNLSQDHTMERRHYQFQYGNLQFLMVDSNDYLILEAQTEYMKDTVNDSEADWRFLVAHKPAYSPSTNHGSLASSQEALLPLNDGLGIDVNLNGHDHVYGRSHFLYGSNPEIKLPEGGGVMPAEICETPPCEKGTLYLLSGTGGAPMYGAFNDPYDKESELIDSIIAFSCGRKVGCLGYSKITIEGKSFRLETYDVDGNRIDEMSYHKN